MNMRDEWWYGPDAASDSIYGPHSVGQPGCRVYVGNLSWDAAWQDLKDHMRGPGVSAPSLSLLSMKPPATWLLDV
jgi:hypothetical protein